MNPKCNFMLFYIFFGAVFVAKFMNKIFVPAFIKLSFYVVFIICYLVTLVDLFWTRGLVLASRSV